MSLVKSKSEASLALAMKKQDEEENIQVFVRVRPLNSREKAKNSYSILDCSDHREVVVTERNGTNIAKTFTFDRVFGPNSKQLEVYRTVVSPLLGKVIQGYNCTVFAYGQTGTGKTFTMEGGRSEVAGNWSNDPMAGIVPRALGQLFDELRAKNAEFTIRVSFLELYNEELYDLLAPADGSKLKTLRLYEEPNKKNSVTISGLEEVIVHSKHEVYQIMEKGSERRKTAATLMNASSSRSHTVLSVIVHIKESPMVGEDMLTIGKLNLVDLAGSESIGRSGAVNMRAREAGNINQSLLTLGRVITALVEHAPHIPYRESKLTRILKDSLGGSTKTSIIATVSPAHINTEETLSTLEYAHRAKNIYNQPVVNQRLMKHLVMSHYTDEIERLRRDLAASREKNGVWIEKDNYEKLQDKLTSFSQELRNNTMQIAELTETLEKCQRDMSIRDAEISDLQEENQTLRHLLEEEKTKYQQSEQQLRKTELAMKEQEHLVEKHVYTEKKLTNEATTLLSTADEVTSHVEELHNKLERKRHAEESNLEAGKRLKMENADHLNTISENINEFRKYHAKFCAEQRFVLDEFLSEQTIVFAEFRGTSKEVFGHLKSVCMESANLVENQNKAIIKMQGINQQEILSKCQESFNLTNAAIDKIIEVELLEMTNKITSIEAGVTQIVESFKNELSHQNTTLSNFVDSNLLFLDRYRNDLKKIQQFQMNAIKSVGAAVTVERQITSNFDEEMQTKLEDLMEGMQKLRDRSSEYKIQRDQQFSSITKELSAAEEATRSCVLQLNNSLESDEAMVKLFISTHTRDLNVCVTAAATSSNSVEEACQTGLQDLQNLSTTLQNEVARQQKCLIDTRNLLDENKTKMESSVNDFKSQFESNQDQICSDSHTLVNGITKITDTTVSRETDFISMTKNAVQNHGVVVNDWSEVQRSSISQQAGKVREFWDSTYLVDKSTGATPQKRAYSYPKSLSATSPHERIIGRFRQTHHQANEDVEDQENV